MYLQVIGKDMASNHNLSITFFFKHEGILVSFGTHQKSKRQVFPWFNNTGEKAAN